MLLSKGEKRHGSEPSDDQMSDWGIVGFDAPDPTGIDEILESDDEVD